MPDATSQFDLFGAPQPDPEPLGPATPEPDLVEIAGRLPAQLRFGTSSWSFPGWAGLVWSTRVSEQVLAREGLAVYAKHPLFRAVGLDRTFYAPLTPAEYRKYVDVVPADFRFVVKAHSPVTMPLEVSRRRTPVDPEFDRFLDAEYAAARIVAPTVEGLGPQLAAIVFQFPPLPVSVTRNARYFAGMLGRFLDALPRGPLYSVELRNPELLGPAYGEVLARNGATHCFNVHPRMPVAVEQAKLVGEAGYASGHVVFRWMLHPLQEYETARERYFPFDRLVDPDPKNRASIVELLQRLLARGQQATVVANNKSEGSAPVTIFTLARELDRKLNPPPPPP